MLSYRQEIEVQGRHFPHGDIAIQIARTGTTGASSARRYTPIRYALGRTSWRGSEGHRAAAQRQFFRPCQTHALQQDPRGDDLTDFTIGKHRLSVAGRRSRIASKRPSNRRKQSRALRHHPRDERMVLEVLRGTFGNSKNSIFGEPSEPFWRLRCLDGSTPWAS